MLQLIEVAWTIATATSLIFITIISILTLVHSEINLRQYKKIFNINRTFLIEVIHPVNESAKKKKKALNIFFYPI